MAHPDCIVCGGPRFLDRRGIPFCEACEPVMASHVVSMQIDSTSGDYVAVCPCGWTFQMERTPQGRGQRDQAVIDHWRTVAATAAEAR